VGRESAAAAYRSTALAHEAREVISPKVPLKLQSKFQSVEQNILPEGQLKSGLGWQDNGAVSAQ
jgi:hypothetical protein